MTVWEKIISETPKAFAERLSAYEDKTIKCVFCVYADEYCYHRDCKDGIIQYLNRELIQK